MNCVLASSFLFRSRIISDLTKRSRGSVALATTVGLFLNSGFASAWASGGPASIGDLKSYWINFVIYICLLFICLRKVIPAAWTARREAIQATVRNATRDLESAEAEVKDVETRTRNLEADKRKAMDEIIRQAEAEASAAVSQAREKATRASVQAVDLLKGEGRAAEVEYRSELVARALQLAREKFQQGAFADKEAGYRDAAMARARRLVQ
jgi:F0F1-type ATP synthase membrane subunit b/b'